mgnify:FL=1
MKTGTSIILLLYLSIGILHGQQTDADKGLPGKLMQDYFSAAQEYALIYNGKEYVDKSPLFLDSTCPLSQAYHQLAAKKANRAKLMEETMRKKRK